MPVSNKKTIRNKRLLTIFFLVLGVFTVFFTLRSLKNDLARPFQPRGKKIAEICADGDCSGAEDKDLKNKDTDQDGLSDWDELNIHGTSPYLKDTDSDGIYDRAEIEAGTDPLCVGQDCKNNSFLKDKNTKISSSSQTSTVSNKQTQNLDININKKDISEDEFLQVLKGEGDSDYLREILSQSGMDDELLEQIEDEELMEIYKQVLQDKGMSGE